MKTLFSALSRSPCQSLFYLLIAGLCAGLLATPYYQLALLPGLGILLFLLLGRWPVLGYYAIVALIPFAAYRKLEGLYKFIDLPWIIGLFLLLLLLIRYLPRKAAPDRLGSNLWPWLLALFIVGLVSALLSPYPATVLPDLFFMIAAALFIALSLIFIAPHRLYHHLPALLILSVSGGSLLAVLGFYFDISLFTELHGASFERGLGGALDPNNQSLMIIFILPLLIYQLLSARRQLPRGLTVILLIVNLLAIQTTYSRGGALILTLTAGLLFWEHRWRFKVKQLGIVLAAAGFSLALLVMVTPASYWERQLSLFKWQEKTLTRRATYLTVGWAAFKQAPLLGNGPGSFRDLYAQTAYARDLVQEGKTLRRFAHNTYLEVLTGLGLVGLALFLALLWRALTNFGRAIKAGRARGDRESASLLASYRVAFIAVLLYLFILSAMYHKYLLLSLALSQAALLPAPAAEPDDEPAALG